MSPLINNWR